MLCCINFVKKMNFCDIFKRGVCVCVCGCQERAQTHDINSQVKVKRHFLSFVYGCVGGWCGFQVVAINKRMKAVRVS